jgi:hypothetical protein
MAETAELSAEVTESEAPESRAAVVRKKARTNKMTEDFTANLQ